MAAVTHEMTSVNGVNIGALHTKVAELDHGLYQCLSSCLDKEVRLQLLERVLTHNPTHFRDQHKGDEHIASGRS